MVAREPTQREPLEGGVRAALPAAALSDRLDEEVSRAERHGTELSCVLVSIDNLEEMAREHGSDLSEQTLGYVAAALGAELRRFDRVGRPHQGGVLVVLPGTGDTAGEIVARRLLARLQTIKVEAEGMRRPLEVTLGLAAWRSDMSGEDLLDRTLLAARPLEQENGGRRPGAREERGTGQHAAATGERDAIERPHDPPPPTRGS
jgi:diguanylate cyclase (GGDEF)-like protein